ncbi:Uu.00g108870.m01.CDS01 [Anthostomella pinea]|uniref:Uu.00g108870.m01.CDS01 n=1 Tax=Anthostomella pinea TaxID=933095 RepID=A0AAI8YG13_9PEZI|nr:Uu.00g108870.m01.CDS01 [Anthostomella pinea]
MSPWGFRVLLLLLLPPDDDGDDDNNTTTTEPGSFRRKHVQAPDTNEQVLVATVTMYDQSEAQTVGYVTAALSLLILCSRLVISRWRREPFDLSFCLVILSILVITARIITNSLYLTYGTASDSLRNESHADQNDDCRIKTGSILVLPARVMFTASLWLQICILLIFYSRITSGLTLVAYTIKATWVVMAATFVAVVLSTFLECRPINLYWQTSPDPGNCVHSYAQLIIQGVSNTILDLMLLFIAFPLVSLRKRRWSERISLYGLFALGTFCIVITIIRVVVVFRQDSSQTARSVWASAQMFVSTFVANAPTIYGSLRVVRRKRSGHRDRPPFTNSGSARNRPSRHEIESWMKMDEGIALTPVTPHVLAPLPPAATWYGEESAPAPHSHASHSDADTRVKVSHEYIGRAS